MEVVSERSGKIIPSKQLEGILFSLTCMLRHSTMMNAPVIQEHMNAPVIITRKNTGIFLEKNIKSTPKNPIIYHSTTPKINMLQTDLFYVANVLRLYANVFIFTANVLIIYYLTITGI